MREFPLLKRKGKAKQVNPEALRRILYCDQLEEFGSELFRLACDMDLEGFWRNGRFLPNRDGNHLFKIKNPSYSQGVRRQEKFEAARI